MRKGKEHRMDHGAIGVGHMTARGGGAPMQEVPASRPASPESKQKKYSYSGSPGKSGDPKFETVPVTRKNPA